MGLCENIGVTNSLPNRAEPRTQPRTFSQFEDWLKKESKTVFTPSRLAPHDVLLERNRWEIERLRKIIEAAEQVDGKTIKSRLKMWRAQLLRLQEKQKRYSSLNRPAAAQTLAPSASRFL